MAKKPKISLFFTHNISLQDWYEKGLLSRELIYYSKLTEYFSVSFFDYKKKGQDKKNISLIPTYPIKWMLNPYITVLFLLMRHWSVLNQQDVFKTNQIQGSEIPLLLSMILKKRLLVRAGYLPSQFAQKEKNSAELKKMQKLEKRVFEKADHILLTTQAMKSYIIRHYQISPKKILVIPNFIDTQTFSPKPLKKQFDVIYVGRSHPQKNIKELIKAVQLCNLKKPLKLLLIGSCTRDQKLLNAINKAGIKVTLIDTVPNHELSDWLNKSKIFVLPSLYEGHPKVLLEAMSCGLACIGSKIEGIREVINNGENGLLCLPRAHSIAASINQLLENDRLRKELGIRARKTILANFDIKIIASQEKNIINHLIHHD